MAAVVSVDGEEVVLQIKVKLRGSMLDMEEEIQAVVNEAGNLATKEALKRFDTTGAPIQIGSARMTSRGLVLKRYETPYGLIDVERHLYQTSAGGKTYCPLDDRAGERLHTIYLGAAPEYGKAKFLERLEREVYAIKLQYPDATYVGIADGAKSNWEFLEKHTQHQILDFYHASEYLTDASYGMYPMQERERTDWLDIACHRLKHESNGASDLLNEMKAILPQRKKQELIDKIQKAITYFTNQGHRMHYEHYRAMNFPIGSGVTEAACKTLIKQRLCQSGMKWKDRGVAMVLRLRALVSTKGRWEQFWDRINQAGLMGLGNLA